MPSTTSKVVSVPRASSTVITPSLPTFSNASAIRVPMASSVFAEMEPTCAISLRPSMSRLCTRRSAMTHLTALSMPRFRSIGLAPAVTFFRPAVMMACARTVAVVVPSPATSLVLEATSLTICAPTFSSLLSSSTSFATVTPSLVTVGEPNFFSMMTLRPLGPRVTLTASASWSTPRLRAFRASASKIICFAMLVFRNKRVYG